MMLIGFNRSDLRMTWQLAKMNIRDRYLGSTLGMAWAVLNPVIMMSVFTFVFGFVFQMKAPGAQTTLGFAVWLIAGYGPWLAISESIPLSASSVRGGSNLVKNITLKAECLPLATALAGNLTLVVVLFFLLMLQFFNGYDGWWALIWLPVLVLLQFFFVSGIGLALAAFNVFSPDIAVAVPNVLLIILFSSPIFYPQEAMPRVVQLVTEYNPFFLLIDSYRRVIIHGSSPDFLTLVKLLLFTGVVFSAGLFVFRRLRPHFDGAL